MKRLGQRGAGTFAAVIKILGLLILGAGLGLVIGWSGKEKNRLTLVNLRDGALAVLQFGAVVFLLLFGTFFVLWLCQSDRITVRQFENLTGDDRFNGMVVAKAVTGELQRIRAVHSSSRELPSRRAEPTPSVSSKRNRLATNPMAPISPSTNLTEVIGSIGMIEVAGAKLPLGTALVALKQLWPIHRETYSVSGRLYQMDSTSRIVIQVQRTNKAPLDFVLTSNSALPQGLEDVVYQAATRVALEFSGRPVNLSWRSFGYLTNALEHYQRFALDRHPEALDDAARQLERISASEGHFHNVWTLTYDLGVTYLEAGGFSRAQGLFERARNARPDDAAMWNALGVAYFEQRIFTAAETAFKRATELTDAPSGRLGSGRLGRLRDEQRGHVRRFSRTRKTRTSSTSERLGRARRDQLDAHPWNGLGNTYVELGNYVEAIKCYHQAIKLQPEAAYPYNGLGNAYVQQNLWERAEKAYRDAIERDEKYAYPHYGLGNISAEKREYDTAIACHGRALELDPKLAYAWNGIGEAYAHLQRATDAVRAHERAIELRPKDPFPLHSLGETYLFLDKYEEALTAIEGALEIDSGAHFAWRSLGDAYRYQQRYADAEKAYRKAVTINPHSARGWDGLAKSTRALGTAELQELIAYYRTAAELNPKEPFSWNQLGEALYNAGEFEESIQAHERAAELDPLNSFALDGIGKANFAMGRTREAITFHHRAREINPNDGYAAHAIAAAELMRGNYALARAENQKAVKLDGTSAYTWNGFGDYYVRVREYAEARAQYEQALEVDPGDAHARNALGRLAFDQGDHAEALKQCEKALELDDRSPATVTIGDILTAEERYDDAISSYQRSTLRNRGAVPAWDGLGKAYTWKGDFTSALEAYDDGLEVRPAEGRLILGRADVLYRQAVSSGEANAFDEASELYRDRLKQSPDLALAAHVRLATIAAFTHDQDAAKDHAELALTSYDAAWRLRVHSDADLLELRALALLLSGRPTEAQTCLAKAVEAGHTRAEHFDSQRVGSHDLLRIALDKDFSEYAKRLDLGPATAQ